jgi:toxin ParE1/3/4
MAGHRPGPSWSPEAITDLKEIWGYYSATAGENTAEKIMQELFDGCGVIVQHPFAGRARHEIRPELRSFVANKYVVFYRLNDNAPEIVRILDHRQDIEENFIA